MIGDNIINDVYGAIDAGLKAIYLNVNKVGAGLVSAQIEENEYTGKFKTITSLSQLKEIL